MNIDDGVLNDIRPLMEFFFDFKKGESTLPTDHDMKNLSPLFKKIEKICKSCDKKSKGNIISIFDMIDLIDREFKRGIDKVSAIDSVFDCWKSLPFKYKLMFRLYCVIKSCNSEVHESKEISPNCTVSYKSDPNYLERSRDRYKDLSYLYPDSQLAFAGFQFIKDNPPLVLTISFDEVEGYLGCESNPTYESEVKRLKNLLAICYLFDCVEFKSERFYQSIDGLNPIQWIGEGNHIEDGCIVDAHLSAVLNSTLLKMDNLVSDIPEFLSKINSDTLPEDDKKQFHLALEWLFDSLVSQKLRQDLPNAFIQQAVAIEALLGDVKSGCGLTKAYAHRIGEFISKTNEEMGKNEKDFIEYYKVRSKLIHGVNIPKKDADKINRYYKYGINLFKKLSIEKLKRL